MEVSKLAAVLHLDDAQFSILAFGENVNAVVLVVLVLLIAITLKKTVYFELAS